MKMLKGVVSQAVSGIALMALSTGSFAQEPTPQSGALAKMPVREITVFKDGHAFVLHEGTLPTDARGNVMLDGLPNPVIGTFWPYAMGDARLQSVVAARRLVSTQNTALSIRELIEANIGAEVVIKEDKDTTYAAKILAVPQKTSRNEVLLEAGETAALFDDTVTAKGSIVLLQNESGVRALPIDRIQDITFKSAPKTQLPGTEWRNLLALNLGWNGPKAATAPVGMMYLQKGVRWIPSYRVELGNSGRAQLKLQATLLNELTDLNGVTANLVIGVPSFAFKDTPDPISLQDTLAQLSRYFRDGGARSGYAFSNAIATQTARMGEYRTNEAASSEPNLGPEIGTGGKNEDLFLFPVKNITLRKGERMTLPISEYSLSYRDIYTLDLPFSPPNELSPYYSTEQQREIARLFAAPKVEHKLRLTNSSTHPLTTAPALILKNGAVLAQGMMTYASPGGYADLDLTTTVDVRVSREDSETKRTPGAMKIDGYEYSRVDMAGKISLTHYGSAPIELEVTRHVLGNAETVEQGGSVTRLNVFEDDAASPSRSFPDWWTRFNGRARLKWNVKLEPRKNVVLNYRWHYFWR